MSQWDRVTNAIGGLIIDPNSFVISQVVGVVRKQIGDVTKEKMSWRDKHLSGRSIPYLGLGCVYFCVKTIQCRAAPNKINSCPPSLLE